MSRTTQVGLVALTAAFCACGNPTIENVTLELDLECKNCEPPICLPACGDRCSGDDGCGGDCTTEQCVPGFECGAASGRCEQITIQDQGVVDCPASPYVTGTGNVWRGADPELLEPRDLPCLEGDGYLYGYYVAALTTSLDDLHTQLGIESFAADHEFLYEPEDPRTNEVEAYYLMTHMAAWVTRGLPTVGDFSAEIDALRANEIYLDYDIAEVESRQLCSYLILGMQGLDHAAVNRDVFTHEFGHHVLFAFDREVRNAMVHEGLADYLSAAFTLDSVTGPSSWSGFDRDAVNTMTAPEDVITKGEYCQINLDRLVAAGLQARYPAVAEQFRTCLELPPVQLDAPEPHWAGQILSGALWDLRDELGEELLHPLLFSALADAGIDDTGDLMDALIAADALLEGGANETTIADAFTARGIDQNLALGFPELPYHSCP